MGKIKQEAFGEFIGKAGSPVGCTWKGIPYMRTLSAFYRFINSFRSSSGNFSIA